MKRIYVTVLAVAFTVSTLFAAQGMIELATSTLGMPHWMAITLAGFLELSLLAVALAHHLAISEGQPAKFHGIATWVIATISGVLSSAHALEHGLDIFTAQAAGLRFVAPLFAAGLWHMHLKSHEWRTHGKVTERDQTQREQAVLIAQATAAGDETLVKELWSQALRDDLVDETMRRLVKTSTELLAPEPAPKPVKVTVKPAETKKTKPEPKPTPEPVKPALTLAPKPEPKPQPAATTTEPASRETVVAEALKANPNASGPDLAAALAAAGHKVSPRTAQRIRASLETEQAVVA